MSQWSNRYSVLEEVNDSSISSSTPTPHVLTSTEGSESISSTPEDKAYIMSNFIRYSTYIPVLMKTLDTGAKVEASALLDCGATGLFLDTKFVEQHHLNTRKLSRPIPVYNVDGTHNEAGPIKEEIDVILTHKGHTEKATFAVCNLGDKPALLGHTWLSYHNPEIDWRSGEVTFSRCPPKCHMGRKKQSPRLRKKSKRVTGPLPHLLWEDCWI